jgi:hypothetical protein
MLEHLPEHWGRSKTFAKTPPISSGIGSGKLRHSRNKSEPFGREPLLTGELEHL